MIHLFTAGGIFTKIVLPPAGSVNKKSAAQPRGFITGDALCWQSNPNYFLSYSYSESSWIFGAE